MNDVPDGVTGFGENCALTPLGRPLTLNVTGAEKPSTLPTPIAKLTELPGRSCWLAGETVSWKSGDATAVCVAFGTKASGS
jgi:hypothetical protein